jgi:histone H3/H4
LGNFLSYKATEIRDRVESVLLTGNLLLVLDEAHRLWPQRNLRYGFPGRIVWVMTMANAGVPIAMISTPQFIQAQKAIEKNGWNSAQLTGRISHFESLPADLSPEDLMSVAKTILPESNAQSLRALAVYARSSARYLAAIDSIAKRARYIASLDARATVTTEDVRRAMQESVIPADTKLHHALAAAGGRPRKIGATSFVPGDPPGPRPPAPPMADESFLPAPSRLASVVGQRPSATDMASLIEA